MSAYEQRVRAWSSTPRWRAEASTFLDALALPPGAEVLDVGTGAGSLQPLLRVRGLRPVGANRWDGWDAAPPGSEAVRADARHLPFASASFDGVVLHHVLAHVASPVTALREARRVLRPAGRLGVATPNAWFVRASWLPSRVRRHCSDPTVVRHLTLSSLRRLAAEAGFHVLVARTWGQLPWTCPIPSFRERLLLVAEVPS